MGNVGSGCACSATMLSLPLGNPAISNALTAKGRPTPCIAVYVKSRGVSALLLRATDVSELFWRKEGGDELGLLRKGLRHLEVPLLHLLRTLPRICDNLPGFGFDLEGLVDPSCDACVVRRDDLDCALPVDLVAVVGCRCAREGSVGVEMGSGRSSRLCEAVIIKPNAQPSCETLNGCVQPSAFLPTSEGALTHHHRSMHQSIEQVHLHPLPPKHSRREFRKVL